MLVESRVLGSKAPNALMYLEKGRDRQTARHTERQTHQYRYIGTDADRSILVHGHADRQPWGERETDRYLH